MITYLLRLFFGKILLYLRVFIENNSDAIRLWLHISYLRNDALLQRWKVIKKKGRTVIDRHVKGSIIEYSKLNFGTKAYYPYLALYTEIRGKFMLGWLPYDYYKCKMLPKINPKPEAFLNDQKTFDYKLFGDFAITPLFLFIRGLFYSCEMEVVGINRVKEYFAELDDLIVIKQERGHGGKQVKIINSKQFNLGGLSSTLNYVIQPYVKQYKTLEELYPHSVNTFRVNTFIQYDGTIVVKYVWLRFGIDGMTIDNISLGGNYLFFYLDGSHSNMTYDKYGLETGDRHINTGYLYKNLRIPMFQEILNRCINAHKNYPYVRLIAWDVCIDINGVPKLLEWNANEPGLLSQEACFGPLWLGEKF